LKPGALSINRGVLGVVTLASVLFVTHFWVDVPREDEWDIVPSTWTWLTSGSIDWRELFAQHNEHRPAVARLLYTSLAVLTHWDTRSGMVVTQLLLLVSGLACLTFARESIRRSGLRSVVPMTLLFLALFTPAQRENTLWGLQFMMYLPGFCLLLALWLAQTTLSRPWIIIGSLLLTVIGSFTVATGLLCWFLIPWVWPRVRHDRLIGEELASRSSAKWSEGWPWALWLIAGGGTFWLYFVDYVKPGHHPSVFAALQTPYASLDGLLLYLGSSFALDQEARVAIARWSGRLLGVLLVALAVWLLRNRRERELMDRAKPWVILGAYGLGAGLLTLVGRIGFGAHLMLPSRYVAFSSWVIIAGIMLVWLSMEQWRACLLRSSAPSFGEQARVRSTASLFWWRACGLTLAAAFLVMYGSVLPGIWSAARAQRIRLLQAKAALMFADASPEDNPGNAPLHPTWEDVRGSLPQWRQAGIVRDAASRVVWLTPERCEMGEVTGAMARGSSVSMKGWAYLPSPQRVADAVVVTASGHPPRPILAVAPRPEDPTARRHSWWQVSLPESDHVAAWAYDAERERAYRLCGTDPRNRKTIDRSSASSAVRHAR
jgi:hypothetical protein